MRWPISDSTDGSVGLCASRAPATHTSFHSCDRWPNRCPPAIRSHAQYVLLEALSKQEVAQNVMEYYIKHKPTLQQCLDNYGEQQGKGFMCWRFIVDQRHMKK